MFKKILAVVAVISIAASLSVSAFAAGEEASHNAGVVSVNGYTKVENATQYTVMVFEDSFTTDNDVDKIYYINQGTTPDGLLAGMLVKSTTIDGVTSNDLPEGDYTVRIGNDTGSVVDIDLKVEKTSEGIKITLNYGDVNGDGETNSADASLILQKAATIITKFTDQESREVPETVGDVNGDGETNSADASLILQKSATIITNFTDQEGNVLTTYTYDYIVPTE